MLNKNRVAILVDGDFFIKRHCQFFEKKTTQITPKYMAKSLQTHCMKHINKNEETLYRIFFYDCKPLSKKAHNPIDNKAIDFSKSDTAIFRNELHSLIINLPCFAIRYGYLDEKNAKWEINSEKYDSLIKVKINFSELTADDFTYKARQKGLDMRIGLDIASLSYKKIVNKIVLISGDSDFVPSAKLARKEGLHFVLDPMGNPIRDDLKEHIDWLKTTLPNFVTKNIKIK